MEHIDTFCYGFAMGCFVVGVFAVWRIVALEADRSMLHRLIKHMREDEEEVLADVFAEVDELLKGD